MNDRRKDTEISAERLAAIVQTYGADPSRWPEAERDPALIRLNADTAASDHLLAARELDSALNSYVLPAASSEMSARILGDFDAVVHLRSNTWLKRLVSAVAHFQDTVWPGAPLWKPAAAFTFSILIGVVAGVVVHQSLLAHDLGDPGTVIADDGTAQTDIDQDN